MSSSPVLEKILAARRANPYSSEKTLEELRDEHRAGGAGIPLPEGTIHEAVDADGVPAEWIAAPGAAEDAVFLFIHGGGYYRGSVEATRSPAARISEASGMRALSIDYRLAPEHPFPAAIDDTYTAWRWLTGQGIEPGRIVVGGISAGGGLTLALLVRLKARREALPAGAAALSAWTDLLQTGESMVTKAAEDPIISKPYLDRMADYYLAGADPQTPEASPLYGDLSGFPPLLLQVGSAETLLDDSRRFAEHAKAAGVEVELEEWEDMFHGWHGSAHVLSEAQDAIENIGRFCRRVLG